MTLPPKTREQVSQIQHFWVWKENSLLSMEGAALCAAEFLAASLPLILNSSRTTNSIPAIITKNVSRHCWMSPGEGGNKPSLVQNHWSRGTDQIILRKLVTETKWFPSTSCTVRRAEGAPLRGENNICLWWVKTFWNHFVENGRGTEVGKQNRLGIRTSFSSPGPKK